MSTGNDDKEYYTIGEISSIVEIKPTVLRFWENEFDELKPIKNKFGHRVYSKNDIETILKIKNLLYDQGLTIKGAKNFIKDNVKSFNSAMVKEKLLEILSILQNKE
jgi:DNA-binding transcriptional MerR regulator